jgi:hypothetical protein
MVFCSPDLLDKQEMELTLDTSGHPGDTARAAAPRHRKQPQIRAAMHPHCALTKRDQTVHMPTTRVIIVIKN